ncbi:hypothetical protein BG004_005914 [Podila humilis]|nr:hypothetical protein BG004_005914 [Podila humilis]
MEVNKDEALRCLDIGRRHLSNGNFASARKFVNKSIALFPTSEAKQFLTRLEQQEESSTSSTPTGSSSSYSGSPNPNSSTSSTPSSTKSSPNPGSSSSSKPDIPRPRSTPIVDHKSPERDYTPEQVAAIKLIRSSGGDFYKVLGIGKDATDSEIKKAYRKLALQMHPDKNAAPGADEAFKIVSKAFTVLSDPQKRAIFDQHGPDDGKSSGVNYDRAHPTGHGFGGMHHQGMSGFGEEISPEELFNMFFGGGQFGGSFHSATFAGPGFSTRSFGNNARQRTQQTQQRQHRQQQAGGGGGGVGPDGVSSGLSSLIQILPLILLFIMSFTSNLFSDSDSSSSLSSSSSGLNAVTPDFSLASHGSFKSPKFTGAHNVPYFVNERKFRNALQVNTQVDDGSILLNLDKVVNGYKVGTILKQLEDNVEVTYLKTKQLHCQDERKKKEIATNRAMGFFGPDKKLYAAAQKMTTPSCEAIEQKFGREYVPR